MDLAATIRSVPDFPVAGILFYDITTLLKNPIALKETIDRLTLH
jgi:adenine phosphoribosyltransferase